MSEPMTDERLVELGAICSEADDYTPTLVYDLEEAIREIRRLREDNKRLKLENASVWKLVNSRADENNKLCKLADAIRTEHKLVGKVLRELDEEEK